MEYLAMRKEKERGYGQHSFEKGLKGEELRKKCIKIIKERKFLENVQLYKSIGGVVGTKSKNRLPRLVDIVNFVNGLSYNNLAEIYLLLILHKRN